jgi:hypothetical protein
MGRRTVRAAHSETASLARQGDGTPAITDYMAFVRETPALPQLS